MKARENAILDRASRVKLTYAGAAEKFREALDTLGDKAELKVEARHGYPVSFFLRLELANCLVLSEGDLPQALQIYDELHKAFPRDPTVSFRYARALLRSSLPEAEIDRALELVKSGITHINDDPMTGPEHWLPIAAQISLGFIHWNKACIAEQARDVANAVVQLTDAVRETTTAYRLWTALPPFRRKDDTYRLYGHKAVSNLLYYTSDILRIKGGNDDRLRTEIRKYMTILHKEDFPMYNSYYKTRDNLMRAHIALGEVVEARELAGENRRELREMAEARADHQLQSFEVKAHLSADEARNWESASEVLADGVLAS